MSKLRVKEILKEREITGRDFAAQLKMSEVGFYKMVSSSGNPPLKRLEEIAAALDVPISELFEYPEQSLVRCPNCGYKLRLSKEEE